MKAVAEAVRRLLDQFDALADLIEDDEPADTVVVGDDVVRIEPTVLVASSEARPEIIKQADFVCDGVNDLDEINLALAAVDNQAWAGQSGTAGRVVLSEGSFYDSITSTWQLWNYNGGGPSIIGQGKDVTFIYLTAIGTFTYGIEMGTGTLEDMTILFTGPD
jgi:hypothetical protein